MPIAPGRLRQCVILAGISLILTTGCDADSADPVAPEVPDEVSEELLGSWQVTLASKAFSIIGQKVVDEKCAGSTAGVCKLAYAAGFDHQSDPAGLAAIDRALSGIEDSLDEVSEQLDALSRQLDVAVADLKLDNAQAGAQNQIYEIRAAYQHLQDFRAGDSAPSAVKGFFTDDSNLPYHYGIPKRLDEIRERLRDHTSQGIFPRLNVAIEARLGGHLPTSQSQAMDYYELIEQYFGYVLAEQAKGLTVVAAAFHYLEDNPHAVGQESWPATSYAQFVSNRFEPIIRDEVNAFLMSVDRYVARITDMDQSGRELQDAGVIGEIYRRADLVASWVMATVSPGDPSKHRILVVRVLGEPQRTRLLVDSVGGIEIVPDPSARCPADTPFQIDGVWGGGIRSLQAAKAYMQFPVHPDLPEGDLKRVGAVRGADDLSMVKYSATIPLGSASCHAWTRTPHAASLLGLGDPWRIQMYRYYADGSRYESGSKSNTIPFGHRTLVLRETAMNRGVWRRSGPWSVHLPSNIVPAPKASGHAGTVSPQFVELTLEAHPKRWQHNHQVIGDVWTDYHIQGSVEMYQMLGARFFFEGWGRVPFARRRHIATVSGTATGVVRDGAANGKYALELHLYQKTGANNANASHTSRLLERGSHQVSQTAGSDGAFPVGSQIAIDIHVRLKADWDKDRESGRFDDSPLDATVRFALTRLLLF